MWRDEKIEYYKESRDFSNIFEPRAEGENYRTKSREDFERRRQRLGEIMKSKQKSSDPGPSSRDSEPRRDLPYDKSYGSFFGPSQPIVTKRVLEEGRNRVEARRAAVAKPAGPQGKPMKQVSSSSKTIVKTQKPVNKTKLKVEKLREARDYSFLFSEGGEGDAAAPQSKPAKSVITPRAGSSSAKPQGSSRPGTSSTPNGARPRPGDSSKRPVLNGSINGRPAPASSSHRNQPLKIASAPKNSSLSKPAPGANVSRAKVPESSSIRRPSSNSNSRPIPAQSRPASVPAKPQLKPKPAAEPRAKPSQTLKRPAPGSARPAPPPVKQKAPPPQRRERIDDFIDDDDDDGGFILPKAFRLRGNYHDEDSDESDMETPFSSIQAEEARSARIAREEDRRELALIEEEERQERLRKKRRKD